MWVAPAGAVTVPPQLFTTLGVVATSRFAGRLSTKLQLMVMTLGFVTEKVMVLGVFTGTVVGLKLLMMDGGSRMMMPTLAVPPLEAPKPAVVVYVNVVGVGVAVILNVPLYPL